MPDALAPLALPRLGFGGGPIGGLRRAVSDAEAALTLEAALAAGLRYFDTAPLYGHGRSETRLGQGLAGRQRSDLMLSTKVGRLLVPAEGDDFDRHGFVDTPPLAVVFDYSRDAALRSLDASLERLRADHVDIALIHDIDGWTHGDAQPMRFGEALDGAYPALARLRESGAVRAIGLGLNEWRPAMAFAERVPIDMVLLAGRYTLLEQEPAETFLPFCLERGIKVVIGGPYNSGILATGAVDGAFYNYAPAPPEVLARVRAIEAVCVAHGVPLPAAALALPLRHPAVASVIPGMIGPAEVAATVRLATTPIPEALWNDLHAAGLVTDPLSGRR